MKITPPSLCTRCAALGKTCCQGREIYITPGDLARIRAYTGDDRFVEWIHSTDPAYLEQDDDPVWRCHVFGSDGFRRTLRHLPNGDCYYLTAQGCRLPLEVRPLLCRLHPFTYTADHLDQEPAAGCPRHLLNKGESVFDAIQMPVALAGQWHRQLYEELLNDEHDHWIDV